MFVRDKHKHKKIEKKCVNDKKIVSNFKQSNQINQNEMEMNNIIIEKVKKVSLNGQGVKYMAFGNWLIERQVAGGLLTSESAVESRKLLAIFSGVEEQVELYAKFASECNAHSKSVKALIRQHNKPLPKAKAVKVVGDAEKKRGRKKKEVKPETEDPIRTLNEQLVAAAQSDEPIAPPEFVRAPKEPENTRENNTKSELDKESRDKRNAEMIAETERVANCARLAEISVKEAEAEAELALFVKAREDKVAIAKTADVEIKKATKAAEAEAKKATKAAEAEAKKTAKAAEAEAKKAAKAKGKTEAVLPIPVLVRAVAVHNNGNDSLDEEELDEELECELFTHQGVEYLIDEYKNIYSRNEHDPYLIGKYDEVTKTIKPK